MTGFLSRAASALRIWLGLDPATASGFGLGRPGLDWPVWSLRPALARRPAPSAGVPVSVRCVAAAKGTR